MQLVERWILARLRHRRFFSLAELNAAIRELLEDLNNRPFQKLEGSRRSWFELLERPVIRPLPPTPFEYAEFKRAQGLAPRLPRRVRAPLLLGAARARRPGGRAARDPRHGGGALPPSPGRQPRPQRRARRLHHRARAHAGVAPRASGVVAAAAASHWAGSIGAATETVVAHILATKPHPEQGYRACLGHARPGAQVRRRPARGGLRARRRTSAPRAARVSPRSSPAASIGNRCSVRCTTRRPHFPRTPTCAARSTTTDSQ